jgi:pyruvate dehydrogenase E1 component alpha subunit
MNQGMLMESMNLAAAWNLPVLFVCKDEKWSITTSSDSVTGGDLTTRASSLGLWTIEADGRDVSKVWTAAKEAINRIRSNEGPAFLRASCVHLEGHFLGYQMLRIVRQPLKEMPRVAIPLSRSFLTPGGGTLDERIAGLKIVFNSILATLRDPRQNEENDPIVLTRKMLQSDEIRLNKLEDNIHAELKLMINAALQEVAT